MEIPENIKLQRVHVDNAVSVYAWKRNFITLAIFALAYVPPISQLLAMTCELERNRGRDYIYALFNNNFRFQLANIITYLFYDF